MSAAEVDGLQALARAEQALLALQPKPFPLPLGRLAPVVAGAFAGVQKGDWVVAGPRERIGAALRGCPVERLVDPAVGARPYKLAPVSGSPGARALHAVGLALACQRPVLCFLGLASVASGAAHEALNTAALTGAPVIFLHVAVPLSAEAPVGPQLAGDVAAIAAAHGVEVATVTSPDLAGLQAAVQQAVALARQRAMAPRPQLLSLTLS